MSFPMKELDIDLETPRFRRIGESAEEAARWSLQYIQPAPGFVGAVAALGPAKITYSLR